MKKRLLALALVLFMFPTIIYINRLAAGASPAFIAGRNARDLLADDTLLVKIEDYEITQNDIDRYINLQKFTEIIAESDYEHDYTSVLDTGAALENLVRNRLYYIEARNRNLVVADEVVSSYIDNMRSAFKNTDILESKEGQILVEFAHGMGMTVDQYLEELFPVYKELLSIGKLKAEIIDPQASLDEQQEEWQEFGQDLFEIYSHLIEESIS